MAELQQLSNLEDELMRIRIYRIISQILALITVFLVAVIMILYWDPLLGPLIGFIIGGASLTIVGRHYGMKEKQVLRQIEKLRLWKGYSER